MDVEFVRELDEHPLSPARRLFVLQQMLSQVSPTTDPELYRRIQRLVELDGTNLRDETRSRCDDSGAYGLVDDRRRVDRRCRAHREFMALMVHIVRSFSARSDLLDPARRQLYRLRRFDDRPKSSPAQTGQRNRSHRFRRIAT